MCKCAAGEDREMVTESLKADSARSEWEDLWIFKGTGSRRSEASVWGEGVGRGSQSVSLYFGEHPFYEVG
jgi:hypothetical protein